MISSLPASRPGLATARFYRAVHDLAQSQQCSRPRHVHTLLGASQARSIDRCHSSPQVHLFSRHPPRSRALVIAPSGRTGLSKSTTAHFDLNPAEYHRFRELDLEHRIRGLSHRPCTVKVEKDGDGARIHITGINRFLRSAITLVTTELGLPAVQNTAAEEETKVLERTGSLDIPSVDPFADPFAEDEDPNASSNVRRIGSTKPVLRRETPRHASQRSSQDTSLMDYDVLQVSRLLRVPQAIANLYPREIETRFMSPGASMKQTRVYALDTDEPVAGKTSRRGRASGDSKSWTKVRITGPLSNVDHVYDQLARFINSDYQKIVKSEDPELPVTTKELESSYKNLMRSVVSPVAVITAYKTLPEGHKRVEFAQCVGATISSLSSVCIKPTPVLTFNLHQKSSTAANIVDSGNLTVHLLTADQHGETIAQAFSDPKIPGQIDRFQAVANLDYHDVSHDGKNVVISGPGVLARAHCHLIRNKTVTIGDHLVMFANVASVDQAAQRSSQVSSSTGLTFGRSTYLRSQPLDAPLSVTAATADAVTQGLSSEKPATDSEEYYSKPSEEMSGVQPVTQTARSSIPTPADEPNSEYQTLHEPESVQAASTRPPRAKSPTVTSQPDDANELLDEILSLEEHPAPESAPATNQFTSSAPSDRRTFSTSTRPTAPRCIPSSSRHYSTNQSHLSDEHPSEPASSKPETPFLQQTVFDYLNLASIPPGRWRNTRALAELRSYGLPRIHAAIRGGTSDAPTGSQPGGRTNNLDQRIRKLIGRLHSANKVGHVSDEVMEELMLEGEERGEGEKVEVDELREFEKKVLELKEGDAPSGV